MSDDMMEIKATDPIFGMVLGERKIRVHSRSQCEGRDIPCCVHSPSDHHMKDWPMTWRFDTHVMERDCPHGIGHPDPDHLAYVRSLTPEHECEAIADCDLPHMEWQSIHGCDGCCRKSD